jgi:Bacterial regulatory proteins, luxR family
MERAVTKTSDFYSTRQWHSTGMYTGCIGPKGVEHHLMQALPELPEAAAGPGRYVRLVLHRGPGPDFSECDRALLVLLRPHLHQAYLDAERRRHPVPRLTPRQNGLLRLVAAGHTNTQIARRLGISESRPACRICLRTPASGGLSYPNRTQVGHICIRVECRDRELRGGQPGHGRGTAGAPWRVLLIEGRAGIGKTSLVEAACLRAGELGHEVVHARGSAMRTRGAGSPGVLSASSAPQLSQPRQGATCRRHHDPIS